MSFYMQHCTLTHDWEQMPQIIMFLNQPESLQLTQEWYSFPCFSWGSMQCIWCTSNLCSWHTYFSSILLKTASGVDCCHRIIQSISEQCLLEVKSRCCCLSCGDWWYDNVQLHFWTIETEHAFLYTWWNEHLLWGTIQNLILILLI